MIVPFRKPLMQSVSLLNQHKRTLSLQKRDPFIRHYMNWLGHHEFGSDHKPFNLANMQSNHYDLQSIDYWLEQWMETYLYLLKCYETFSRSIIFTCYEELCGDSGMSWKLLLRKLNVEHSQERTEFRLRQSSAADVADGNLLVAVEDIYNNLRSLS